MSEVINAKRETRNAKDCSCLMDPNSRVSLLPIKVIQSGCKDCAS